MNKKKIYWIVYAFVWILLIIYLCFSNRLILLSIPEEQILKKVDVEEYQSFCTPIFNIESIEYVGDMLESVRCTAWAFCETDYDNSNKMISIIFKDTTTTEGYMCEGKPQLRADVYSAYKNKKNIYNGMSALNCEFSTLILPDGIYELLIYVKENEYDYGIATTGLYYKKTSTEFSNVDINGKELVQTISDAAIIEGTVMLENFIECGQGYIEDVKKTSENLVVSGWASYSPETNLGQKVVCAITFEDNTTKYYTTQIVNRNDVAKHFNNDSYAFCGFKTAIPLDEEKDMYSLSLIAEIDGNYYPIAFNAKIIQETEPLFLSFSEENEEGMAYIDKYSFGDDVVIVKGWASYSSETNEEQKVYIGLTDVAGITKYYAAESYSRGDVAKSKGESYLNCGYSAEIRLLDLEDEYTVSVVIQVGEEFFPINIKNSRVIKRN